MVAVKNLTGIETPHFKVFVRVYKTSNNSLWFCKCKNCYNFCIRSCKDLYKNKIKSCGCLSRKYTFNQDFFETIDTEEKAYWLGFITADGCIHDVHIHLALQPKDKTHLEKLKSTLEATYPIRDFITSNKYFAVKMSLASRKMVTDLYSLGITERKSLTVKPCTQIPDSLLRHYWRGLIDGDGCISVDKVGQPYLSLTSNFDICEGFRKFALTIVQTRASSRSARDTKAFRLMFGGNKLAVKIITLLYKDASIYLDRKMALARQVTKDFTL